MNPSAFACIIAGVLLNACAQLLLKSGVSAVGHFDYSLSNLLPIGWRIAQQWQIIAGLGCYVISVVVWILALSRVDVSIAYPMLSLGYVVNALIAWHWMGERLTATQVGGIGIILVGVFLLTRA